MKQKRTLQKQNQKDVKIKEARKEQNDLLPTKCLKIQSAILTKTEKKEK